jgi:hypothetical protein
MAGEADMDTAAAAAPADTAAVLTGLKDDA